MLLQNRLRRNSEHSLTLSTSDSKTRSGNEKLKVRDEGRQRKQRGTKGNTGRQKETGAQRETPADKGRQRETKGYKGIQRAKD